MASTDRFPGLRFAKTLAAILSLISISCASTGGNHPDDTDAFGITDTVVAGDTGDSTETADATSTTETADPGLVVDAGYQFDTPDMGEISDAPDTGDTVDTPDAGDTADAPPPTRSCNGMPELCDRPLDQIAFVTTHNAMANQDDSFLVPNQYSSVTRQLQAGVRAFMLDTWYDNTQDPPPSDDVYLCHGVCVFGMRLLSGTLADIRAFLLDNPDDFVVIIFESYVSAAHTLASFDQAGVTEMLLNPLPGQPLPTLAQAIDGGKRMLVLTDSGGGGFPGYLSVWDWAFETHWSNKVPDDLSCATNRGSDENPFFILNHFLTDPTALPELAAQINENPFFMDRAMACWKERDHIPNFVTIDFFEIGDVLDVVSQLNLAVAPIRR
ncbi:MAG TPA: hypothetical protein PKG82_10010 [Myxococcota bacterium]|nr:hypothetical protein [Myxococcota bacterium]